jgi:hypothetical protein
MAYIIFNENNELVKIASNASDRDSLHLVLSNLSVTEVSDIDFLKIKKNMASVSYDGLTVTVTDFNEANSIETQSKLESYLKDIIKYISYYTNSNKNHLMYNEINSYKEYLENFDVNSLTFPLNKSWEEYCSDNSITFYHPLQIP